MRETARTLWVRFKEHTLSDGKYPNLAITKHTSTTGNKYTVADDVEVLVKEDSDVTKKVKEGIAIHKKKSALNRD